MSISSPSPPSFYKKPLPPSCISFTSPAGQTLFANALRAGGMGGYFALASQFLTQNEPAFCGLGTLCMILNALEVDPGKQWKGSWRWYEQEVNFILSSQPEVFLDAPSLTVSISPPLKMLDCCRPLTAISQVGITLSEFACLARCNGLRADIFSPSSKISTDPPSSPSLLESMYGARVRSGSEGQELSASLPAKRRKLDPNSDPDLQMTLPSESISSSSQLALEHVAALTAFRKDLIRISKGGDGMMALSYSRKALGQTGEGHFSPVAGYSEVDDKILILDVARFKYPSYWISVEDAYASMLPIDIATGQPRGYAILSVLPQEDPTSLAAPLSLTRLNLNKASYKTLSAKFRELQRSSDTIQIILSFNALLFPIHPLLSPRPGADLNCLLNALQNSYDPSKIYPNLRDLNLGEEKAMNRLLLHALFPKFGEGIEDENGRELFLSTLNCQFKLVELSAQSTEEERKMRELLMREVEGIRKRVEALGKCCQDEEEGGVCACSGTV